MVETINIIYIWSKIFFNILSKMFTFETLICDKFEVIMVKLY